MNLRRFVFTTSVMLLGLCTAPARAFTAGSTAALSLPNTIPDPAPGLLFFVGVAAIAGALELRRRTYLRAEGKSD